MKTLGIILIVLGIVMFLFRGINFTEKKKVVDVGPVEINRNEHKRVQWPDYAGGISIVAGIVCLFAARKSVAAV